VYDTLREWTVSCAPRQCAVTGTHRRRAQCIGLARHNKPIVLARHDTPIDTSAPQNVCRLARHKTPAYQARREPESFHTRRSPCVHRVTRRLQCAPQCAVCSTTDARVSRAKHELTATPRANEPYHACVGDAPGHVHRACNTNAPRMPACGHRTCNACVCRAQRLTLERGTSRASLAPTRRL